MTVRRDGRRVEVDASRGRGGRPPASSRSGDRIPADATAAYASGLLVDTSLLTGESAPSTHRARRRPCLRRHVRGRGRGGGRSSPATGGSTRLADIARLTTLSHEARHPADPRAAPRGADHRGDRGRRRRHVLRAVAMLLGNPPSATGSCSPSASPWPSSRRRCCRRSRCRLAWGAEQMAKRQVLVREPRRGRDARFDDVHLHRQDRHPDPQPDDRRRGVDAGRAMALTDGPGYDPTAPVVLSDPEARGADRAPGLAAIRCSTGYAFRTTAACWRAHGDPMEAALDVFARRLGVDTDAGSGRLVVDARFPFDPRRRRMSAGGRRRGHRQGRARLPSCRSASSGDDGRRRPRGVHQQGPAGARRRQPARRRRRAGVRGARPRPTSSSYGLLAIGGPAATGRAATPSSLPPRRRSRWR